jgi:regulator of replication initiation timing
MEQQLKQQLDSMIDTCLEKDVSLNATQQKIKYYNDALKVKDKNQRIKAYLFTTCKFSIFPLVFVFLIYKSNLGLVAIKNYLHLNEEIIAIVGSCNFVKSIRDYMKDYKEYKKMGRKYGDISVEEIKQKIQKLKELEQSLQMDLEQLRPTLGKLKKEVASLELSKEKEQFMQEMNSNINCQNMHFDTYDIPKVKVKRRDEYVTKTKRNI